MKMPHPLLAGGTGHFYNQPKGINMAKKQSTPKTSTLAAKVLSGSVKPTPAQTRSLAASVLGQDEKRGQATTKKTTK
jgi:hypothetical protein